MCTCVLGDLVKSIARACLKIAFYKMCFTLCGRFVPNLAQSGGRRL